MDHTRFARISRRRLAAGAVAVSMSASGQARGAQAVAEPAGLPRPATADYRTPMAPAARAVPPEATAWPLIGREAEVERMAALRSVAGCSGLIVNDAARVGKSRLARHATATATAESEGALVALAARGLTNAEIAQRLVVSVRTVESHIHRAMQKLGVSDRRDL